jgi:hypothetical protein
VRKAAHVFAAAGQWQQAHQAMLVCAGFYQLDVSSLEPSCEVRFDHNLAVRTSIQKRRNGPLTRQIQFQSEVLGISPSSDVCPRKAEIVSLLHFIP